MIRLRSQVMAKITTKLVVFPIESFSLGVRLSEKIRFNYQTEEK
jgi:hypothetical protein